MNNLQIVKSEKFGELTCDIYKNDKDFYMTREQIGMALEYAEPKKAIEKLHLAHADRFSVTPQSGGHLFSVSVRLTAADGKQYNTTLYTRKGIMEICRWSRQPKADAFMDWVWDIMDGLVTGDYTLKENKPQCLEDIMIVTLQEMKNVKQQVAAVNERVNNISEIVALNPTAWRDECRIIIVKIANKIGGNEYIRDVNAEIYKLLDERAGCSLETRLTNKRRRMADEGICKSKREKLNKMDVIAEDKKLIEIFIAIVKEMAIKNGVGLPKDLVA